MLGKSAGEGAVYAKDLSKPAVFTVEVGAARRAEEGAGDYRQKDLFDARSFNTTRIEMVRNGLTTAFEKTSRRTRTARSRRPGSRSRRPRKDVDQTKVEDLIAAVTQARATSFVDAPREDRRSTSPSSR